MSDMYAALRAWNNQNFSFVLQIVHENTVDYQCNIVYFWDYNKKGSQNTRYNQMKKRHSDSSWDWVILCIQNMYGNSYNWYSVHTYNSQQYICYLHSSNLWDYNVLVQTQTYYDTDNNLSKTMHHLYIHNFHYLSQYYEL